MSTNEEAERRALRPLWLLATGTAIGAAASMLVVRSGSPVLHWSLLAAGGAALGAAVLLRQRQTWSLWLAAGLALAGGHGLLVRADALLLERTASAVANPSLRTSLRISEGWTPSTWGWQSRVRVLAATLNRQPLDLPRRTRLEVRGDVDPGLLPPPGSTVEALTALRGDPTRPLLVASSPRLLNVVEQPRGVARLRDRLAGSLLAAASTDVRRIRSAELAATLALGRRDLMPIEARNGWRRSGLAHLLAVSGLHVGLVAGILWLGSVAIGLRPTAARFVVLVALPVYAVAAGASPSALRAALMGVIYLVARLCGRPLIPMAAVLLAAVALLLASPTLVADAGFQLTVVITAALIRWVPALAQRLPGPRWISGAAAVPIVAQLAALPLVAWHFRTVVPGAVIANLAAPPLLAPTISLAVGATLVAPLWPAAAGLLLDGLGSCERALWLIGAAGRAAGSVAPAIPPVAAGILVAAGWMALRPGRRGRLAAAAWLTAVVATGVWWQLRPSPPAPSVTLLPVADGLAAVVATPAGQLLVDSGRYRREAAELLADRNARRLEAAIASHSDDDHTGGMRGVLESSSVARLVVPAWMTSDSRAVPLIRSARRRAVRLCPVTRGSSVAIPGARLEVLWPPAVDPPEVENERSLVARLRLDSGTILVTSDIGQSTERTLAGSSFLRCEVLLVPHHGSRRSTSTALLGAAQPDVALVPAALRNTSHHPHDDVIERLVAAGIPFRYPARDGACGARPVDGIWRPFP